VRLDQVGRGCRNARVDVPRGKELRGSNAINGRGRRFYTRSLSRATVAGGGPMSSPERSIEQPRGVPIQVINADSDVIDQIKTEMCRRLPWMDLK
jgi:hypothetical protein